MVQPNGGGGSALVKREQDTNNAKNAQGRRHKRRRAAGQEGRCQEGTMNEETMSSSENDRPLRRDRGGQAGSAGLAGTGSVKDRPSGFRQSLARRDAKSAVIRAGTGSTCAKNEPRRRENLRSPLAAERWRE